MNNIAANIPEFQSDLPPTLWDWELMREKDKNMFIRCSFEELTYEIAQKYWITKNPHGKALDICTGIGASAIAMTAAGLSDVTAIDIDPTALVRAQDSANALGMRNIKFIRGNMLNLPIADKSIEFLTALNCLYLTNWRGLVRAASEIDRVTQLGAQIVVHLVSAQTPAFQKAKNNRKDMIDDHTVLGQSAWGINDRPEPLCYTTEAELNDLFKNFDTKITHVPSASGHSLGYIVLGEKTK